MTFGEMVARLRELRGMSQADVAAAGGRVTAAAVCRLERGDRENPTLATVLALAEALGFELHVRPAGLELVFYLRAPAKLIVADGVEVVGHTYAPVPGIVVSAALEPPRAPRPERARVPGAGGG